MCEVRSTWKAWPEKVFPIQSLARITLCGRSHWAILRIRFDINLLLATSALGLTTILKLKLQSSDSHLSSSHNYTRISWKSLYPCTPVCNRSARGFEMSSYFPDIGQNMSYELPFFTLSLVPLLDFSPSLMILSSFLATLQLDFGVTLADVFGAEIPDLLPTASRCAGRGVAYLRQAAFLRFR